MQRKYVPSDPCALLAIFRPLPENHPLPHIYALFLWSSVISRAQSLSQNPSSCKEVEQSMAFCGSSCHLSIFLSYQREYKG